MWVPNNRSDAERRDLGAALWFQQSVTYLPEPARNWVYPKGNQMMLSTD